MPHPSAVRQGIKPPDLPKRIRNRLHQAANAQGGPALIWYGILDERGRNDLIVNLDAMTGETIDDILGY